MSSASVVFNPSSAPLGSLRAMAQQMILKAHQRRRAASVAAANLGGGASFVNKDADLRSLSFALALKEHSKKLYSLFSLWDEDGNGYIDEVEFQRAVKMLGLKFSKGDFEAFCKMCNGGVRGSITLEKLTAVLESTPDYVPKSEGPPPSLLVRLMKGVYDFLSLLSMQTLLYFAFVIIFQSLTETLRVKEEFYLDTRFSNTFIDNMFDSDHNTFESIRRVSDIYEWGNMVLVPGLLGDSPPSCGLVGDSAVFSSSTPPPANGPPAVGSSGWNSTLFKAGCNEHAWPDGEVRGWGRLAAKWGGRMSSVHRRLCLRGAPARIAPAALQLCCANSLRSGVGVDTSHPRVSFAQGAFQTTHPTDLTVEEIAFRLNEFDWTDGLQIWQARVGAQPASTCFHDAISDSCHPEFENPEYQNTSRYAWQWPRIRAWLCMAGGERSPSFAVASSHPRPPCVSRSPQTVLAITGRIQAARSPIRGATSSPRRVVPALVGRNPLIRLACACTRPAAPSLWSSLFSPRCSCQTRGASTWT